MKSAALTLALTLLACFFSVTTASAATVTFHTTGAFAGPNLLGSGLTSGGSTLTFTGTGDTDVSTGLFNVTSFGVFTLSSTTVAPNFDSFVGDTFTLSIVQTSPSGLGTSTADVAGEVSSTTGGVLVINFLPSTFTLGPATYSIPNAVSVPFPTAANPSGAGNATIQGNVAVTAGASTPLPAAAAGGLSLFGLLGATRRRKVAA